MRKNNRRTSLESQQKRERAIVLIGQGMGFRDVLAEVGVQHSTYARWRERWPEFAGKFDAARAAAKHRKNEPFDGSFTSFRQRYLNMSTTWFQAAAVEAIENAKPGEVTMVLWPPEHGKTTLLEDWCTYKLCTDPTFRITVASARMDHPKKVLARVKKRFDPRGPTPALNRDFGPLAPLEGHSEQIWAATQFNVAKKMATDERDYSMSAIGITGSVQGTRSDLMLIDDVMSLNNLNQADEIFEKIRQDFLSRPSVFGRTVIIGTRVGEFDVYRKLLDAGIVDHYVKFPAYSVSESPVWPAPSRKPDPAEPESLPPPGVQFLWADRYSPLQYAQLRHRVGEAAWWRNYMQRPEAASAYTFTEAVTSLMRDESRSTWGDPAPLENGEKVPCVVSVDPAIGGGNATGLFAMRERRIDLIHCNLRFDVVSNRQIFDLIEEYLQRATTAGSKPVEVVIEDKAFQRGLMRDDRAFELEEMFGVRFVGHTTGRDKQDSDIGVPSLEQAMRRREISVPAASEIDDVVTYELFNHLHQWRPGIPGNKLAQDMVMMLWFAWRRWRMHRVDTTHEPEPGDFRGEASPLRSARRRPLPGMQRTSRRAMVRRAGR